MDNLRRWMAALSALVLVVSMGACSEAVPGESGEESVTETVHRHEYHLEDTVEGDCANRGYQLYVCACEDSFKSLLPATHTYEKVTDTTGNYIKTVCSKCGDYSISREQKYVFHIDFENVESKEEAANQPPNCEYYGQSGTSAELVRDSDGTALELVASNYYIQDISGTMKSGRKFVFSMDVMFEKYPSDAALFSIVYFSKGAFGWNDGLIRVGKGGKLTFAGAGDGKHTDEVVLSDKGYNNIAVVGDLDSCLYDVYLNGVSVRTGIAYQSKDARLEKVYVRFLDREKDFKAVVDHLKLYDAASPEFVIEEDGIVFEK